MGTNRKKKREMVKGKWIYILGRDKFKGRGGYNVKSQNVYWFPARRAAPSAPGRVPLRGRVAP